MVLRRTNAVFWEWQTVAARIRRIEKSVFKSRVVFLKLRKHLSDLSHVLLILVKVDCSVRLGGINIHS